MIMNSKGNLKATLQKDVSLVQIMHCSGQMPQHIETSTYNIFDITNNIIKYWIFSAYICHPTKPRSLFTLLYTGYDTSTLEIMFT